ncbi:hypothetical protein HT031_006689 [Scenedesmus sp. PABB004]|nr:hypothetical protein HT031_006689 [Scenedesmus sp. PABB004]
MTRLAGPAAVLALLAAAWVPGALGQLPNLRVGLPRDEDSLRRVNSQRGYEVKQRDIPFGERFKVQFSYYDLPDQPLYYRNKAPMPVACCYSFNAYWTANAGAAAQRTARAHGPRRAQRGPAAGASRAARRGAPAAAAIHPYWFKEFGLDRWCRQDVCLSIWTEDHSHDLMWKVTDVCDPKDCPTPLDVKVEPYKGKYLWYNGKGSRPRAPVYMYFVKCWADGLPQPDLDHTLPGPPVTNSRHWMIKTTKEQWQKNQDWNRANGRPFKPLGMLVRPWATQYSVDGFKASDYPPGSSKAVKPPSWCNDKSWWSRAN